MEAVNTKLQVRDLAYTGLFAALMAVCAWISIPVPPPLIPFTLQTMGVFLAVGLLGGKRGTIAVLVYILLGAVGAPVFAGFRGGIPLHRSGHVGHGTPAGQTDLGSGGQHGPGPGGVLRLRHRLVYGRLRPAG